MKIRRVLAAVWSLALASSTPALAQLAPPNDAGVALGHIHLVVKDVEAQKPFWTTMLGGKLVTNGPLTLIEFPGIYVMLRQADPSGPPAGSTVDHFGLVYKEDRKSTRLNSSHLGISYAVF